MTLDSVLLLLLPWALFTCLEQLVPKFWKAQGVKQPGSWKSSPFAHQTGGAGANAMLTPCFFLDHYLSTATGHGAASQGFGITFP